MVPVSDDDLLPGLPPLDDDEERGVEGEDLDALGVGDDEEDVGLDDDAGVALDSDELLDVGERESEGWTGAEDDAAALIPAEVDEEFDGEEQGWIADSETAGLELLEGDDQGGDDESSGLIAADSGEEGVEETGLEDVGELPPLQGGAEVDAEEEWDLDLGLGLGRAGGDEDAGDGGELAVEPEAVVWIEPATESIAAVLRAGDALFAAGDSLFRVERERLVDLAPRGLVGRMLTSLAIDPRDARNVVVGTRIGGAFRSLDGGESFEAITQWLPPADRMRPCWVHAERHAAGARIWLRTEGGRLYVSDDLGARFREAEGIRDVVAAAADPGGGLVALARAADVFVLRRSTDGESWDDLGEPIAIGRGRAEDTFTLGLSGSAIAVGRDGDGGVVHVSTDRGARWIALEALARPTAIAIADVGATPDRAHGAELYVAAWNARSASAIVVRRDATGTEARLFDSRRMVGRRDAGASEGEARVSSLWLDPTATARVLWVATGIGLFRITLAPTEAEPG